VLPSVLQATNQPKGTIVSTHEITRPADRVPAWERTFGITKFAEPVEPVEGIATAGLDFRVEKQEMFAGAGLVPKHQAAVRIDADGTETILGVVGEGRPVTQWSDHLGFVQAVVNGHEGVRLEFCGALRGGAQVFYGFTLPDAVIVPEAGERADAYLFFRTSHDASAAQTLATQLLRPMCTNQFGSIAGWALKRATTRHTTNMAQKAEQARRALGLAFRNVEKANGMIREGLAAKVSEVDFWKFVEGQFPITPDMGKRSVTMSHNSRDAIMDIWRGTTQANIRGTRWGAEQAFVEYADWFRGADAQRAEQTLVGGRDAWKARIGTDLLVAFPA
jgi:phage/plasmid-like protein (TIGR03299 family)